MEKLKVLSLFSGYGTDNFALKQLGIPFECIAYSDIDKYANYCFRHNHFYTKPTGPGTIGMFVPKELGDVKLINPNELEDFDLLTGGTPCQDFSVAGKGKGLFDENGELTRSGLLFEYVRILKAKKPKYFLWENVKGVLTTKHKDAFVMFLELLSDCGYKIDFKLLNTKDYGVPQNRERVFVVGVRND